MGWIVVGSGSANEIVSFSGDAFEARIASRRVHSARSQTPTPGSAVELTTSDSAAVTGVHAENSDVFPVGKIEVPVITSPAAPPDAMSMLKDALPSPSVTTNGSSAMNLAPSPCPDGSHAELRKSWISWVLLPGALSVPATESVSPSWTALVITGKFWSAFAPTSPSPGSFGVTPSPPRSIPSPPFSWMLLWINGPRWLSGSTWIPSPSLNAMVFSPAASGPTVLLPRPLWESRTPASPLPSGLVPSAPVPIRLPATTLLPVALSSTPSMLSSGRPCCPRSRSPRRPRSRRRCSGSTRRSGRRRRWQRGPSLRRRCRSGSPRSALSSDALRSTPGPVLPETRLPYAAPGPPTTLLTSPPESCTPTPFGMLSVPVTSVPTRLPRITLRSRRRGRCLPAFPEMRFPVAVVPPTRFRGARDQDPGSSVPAVERAGGIGADEVLLDGVAAQARPRARSRRPRSG